jgi:hypothetical protein
MRSFNSHLSNPQTLKPKDAWLASLHSTHLTFCNYFSQRLVNASGKSVVNLSTKPFNALNQSKLKIRFLFKAVFHIIKVVLATHQREKKSLFDKKINHQSDFCTLSDTFRGIFAEVRAGCGAILRGLQGLRAL